MLGLTNSKNSLDFRLSVDDTLVLKGIAICGMLCWHLFYCANPLGVDFGMYAKWIGIIGDVCVSLFLFCSGYGLSVQYNKIESHDENNTSFHSGGGRALKFILKRFIKFYFNYWFVFVIVVCVGVGCFNIPIVDSYGVSAVLGLLKQFFCLSGHGAYNPTWWFNTLIIGFYLLFIVLYSNVKLYPIYMFLIALLLSHLSFSHFPMDFGIYTLSFMLGILVALHNGRIQCLLNKIPKTIIIIGVQIVVIGCCWWLIRYDNGAIYCKGIRVYGVLTIMLYLNVVLWIRQVKGVSSILKYLGKHSANIYLIHTFLFYFWFPKFFLGSGMPFVSFILLLIISLCCSIVIEYLKNITKYNLLESKIISIINAK